jgi:branched-chain amino acid aminotransferase
MAQKLVMIDGELFAPEHAKVSVFDRGFLYGDSVFETIRTYDGRPFALDEHLDRLERSARLVAIDMPVSKSVMRDEVLAAVSAAGNPESYVRVTVTRGSGALGLDPGLATQPLRVIIVAPLGQPPAEAYAEGIAAITYRTQRATDDTNAEGAKVGNYLVSVLAMRAAVDAGAAEALIVDGNGRVVEGATSNVFVVSGGRLTTPPDSAGILPGITRAHLLAVCAAEGIDVNLSALPVERVRAANEIFISSSIREVLPVVRVDGHGIGNGQPGPLTKRLHGAFMEKVKEIHGLMAMPASLDAALEKRPGSGV